jgi:hypothetical protein
MLGEIVMKFKWQMTRTEWIKALRRCEDSGQLKMSGTEDSNPVKII